MDTRFHCVYLLVSLDPLFAHKYYIGYTINPIRRLRQHNGELVNGASFTRRNGRPWKLVCCVSGFTEDRVALKFEWCWQNPHVSARLKHTAPLLLRGLHGLPFAVGILHLLLHSHLFTHLELTLHLFDANRFHAAAAVAQAHKPRMQRTTRYKQNTYTNSIDSHCNNNCSSNSIFSESANNFIDSENERISLTQPLCSAATSRECNTHLPELKANSLLHIETITLSEFEKKYLSEHSDSWLEELDEKCDLLSLCNTQRIETSLSQLSCEEQEKQLRCESVEFNQELCNDKYRACSEPVTLLENRDANEGNEDSSFIVQRVETNTLPLQNENKNDESLLEEMEYSNSSFYCINHSETEDTLRSRSRSESPPTTPTLPHTAEQSVKDNNNTISQVYSQKNKLMQCCNNNNNVKIPLRFHHMSKTDLRQMHKLELQLAQQQQLTCTLCTLTLTHPFIVRCTHYPFCALKCHLMCLAMWFNVYGTPINTTSVNTNRSEASEKKISNDTKVEGKNDVDHFMLVPLNKVCSCPLCHVHLHWAPLIRSLKRRARESEYEEVQRRRHMMEQRWAERLRFMQSVKNQKNKQNTVGNAIRKGRWVCKSKAINNKELERNTSYQEENVQYAQTQMEIVNQEEYSSYNNNNTYLSNDVVNSNNSIICGTKNNCNGVRRWNGGNRVKRARSASPTVLVRESRLLAPDMCNAESSNITSEKDSNHSNAFEFMRTEEKCQKEFIYRDNNDYATPLKSKVSAIDQSQTVLSATPAILGLTEFNEEE